MQQAKTKNKTIAKRIKSKKIWKNVHVVLQENE
jgi:hypothetical protein